MRWHKILWLLLTLVPLVLLIIGYLFPASFFSSQESIRSFVTSFGAMAPLIFVGIQIIQVVLTPLSHYAVSLAGGYIFGTWTGFLLNWIGRVMGTSIAFFLGKKLGRPLIQKLVIKKNVERYDQYADRGAWLLFLAYFLPLFPDDELSYLAGISSMKARLFLPLMTIGHLSGSLALAYAGNGIASIQEPLFIFLSGITLVGGILFVLLFKKMKNQKERN